MPPGLQAQLSTYVNGSPERTEDINVYTDRELALYNDLQSAVTIGMELRRGFQTHEGSLDASLPHKRVPPPMTAATEAAYRWLTRQEDALAGRPEVDEVSWIIDDEPVYFEEMAQFFKCEIPALEIEAGDVCLRCEPYHGTSLKTPGMSVWFGDLLTTTAVGGEPFDAAPETWIRQQGRHLGDFHW
jgi:hypothetical protein